MDSYSYCCGHTGHEFRTTDGDESVYLASAADKHNCCGEDRRSAPNTQTLIIRDRWAGGPCERLFSPPQTLVPPPTFIPPPSQSYSMSKVPKEPCHTEPRWPGGNPEKIPAPHPSTIPPPPPPTFFYTPSRQEEVPCDAMYRWPAGNKEPKCLTPEQQQESYNNRYRATCRCRKSKNKNSTQEQKCPERRWPGGAVDNSMPPPPTLPVICSGRSKFLVCNSCYDRYAYLLKDKEPAAAYCNKERGYRCPDTCQDKIHAESHSNDQNIPEIQMKRESTKDPCKCKVKRLNQFDYCSQW